VIIKSLHDWNLGPAEAVALQERLRTQVRLVPIAGTIERVAAADVAYSPARRRLYAAATVVALPSLELLELAHAERSEDFAYVPGLFAFRELPALLDALARLTVDPDVVLFDGHGIAHPRRFGLASHAGILLGVPTIGCAKCVLTGRYADPPDERGAFTPLLDNGETVGAALRTRRGVMPVFVSPGHLADTDAAVRVALAAGARYRIPEPLRQAHMAAVRARGEAEPGEP
jgi:deoxyribonuclease V